jgi:transposase
VFLACGTTDMRKGFDRLAAQVQLVLAQDRTPTARAAYRWRTEPVLCLYGRS